MKIAAVIVAAGSSSRFGDNNKLLAPLRGVPLIRHVTAAVTSSSIGDAVLVVAPDGDAIVAAAGDGPWHVVINADAAAGLSGSIRTGIAAVDPSIDGALIILGDMPFVTPAIISKLCETFADCDGARIVFPVTPAGRQANPVLWPRALFADLLQLTGDTGGKALLAANTRLHAPVKIDDDAVVLDIDTVDDLANAEKKRP